MKLMSKLIGRARNRVMHASRKKKLEQFYAACSGGKVLDVGVSGDARTPRRNPLLETFRFPDECYTGLGVEDFAVQRIKHPHKKFVTYTGGAFPFANKSFDWIFCNAVIANIGNEEAQLQFIDEMMRVAKNVFFTTPNKYFPVESHTNAFFLHWLPGSLFFNWCRKKKSYWNRENLHLFDHARLINIMEKSSAKRCVVRKNRVCGWTMSFSVVCHEGVLANTRPLRIFMLGLRGFPNVEGGVETHAENLCTSLAEMGCEVIVIVRSAYHRTEIGQVWRNVRFKPIWAPRMQALEAVLHTFLGVLYAAIKRPDILHIQAIGPSLMTPLARLLGLRVVVTHHGPDYDRQKWGKSAKFVLRAGELLGMRFSNERIVISEAIRKIVEHKHGVKSVLIPNGVNLPAIPDTNGTLEQLGLVRKRYVLMVSRFVPEKRHHDLIQAFRQSALEDWKLVLVGAADQADPYAQSVLQAVTGIPNIICAGFQTGNALKELYAHAGFFVLPSSHEGLPIVLLEALSFGLSIVASDIPAHMGIDCDEISYYPLGDVRSLTRQLKKRAAGEVEREQRERLRQYILDRYKWSEVAQKTHDIYARMTKVMPF